MKISITVLLFGISVVLQAQTTFPGYLPTNGLIAYFPMESNKLMVSTIIGLDLKSYFSSGGQMGIQALASFPLENSVTTFDGKAGTFNDNRYLRLENTLAGTYALEADTALSYMVWAKRTNSSKTNANIMSYRNGVGGYYFKLMLAGQTLYVRNDYKNIDNSIVTFEKSISGMNANQWYHFAVTISKGEGKAKFYVDGTLTDIHNIDFNTFYNVTTSTGRYFVIGSLDASTNAPAANAYLWAGAIDEVALYKRALNENEIKNVYIGQSRRQALSGFPLTVTSIAPGINRNYPLSNITASSGLPVAFTSSNNAVAEVVTVAGGRFQLMLKQIGTVNITATQAGNANFDAVSKSSSLTLLLSNQSINGITANATYTYTFTGVESVITLPGISSSGLPVEYIFSNPNNGSFKAPNASMYSRVGLGAEITIKGPWNAIASGMKAVQYGDNKFVQAAPEIQFYVKVVAVSDVNHTTPGINDTISGITNLVDNNIELNSFFIAPNPVKNQTLVFYSPTANLDYKVYDIQGKLVFSSFTNQGKNSISFGTRSGLYSLIIQNKSLRFQIE